MHTHPPELTETDQRWLDRHYAMCKPLELALEVERAVDRLVRVWG